MNSSNTTEEEEEAPAICADHSDLLRYSIDDAINEKWRRGREAYGGGDWVGPPPEVCAHDEGLDLASYLLAVPSSDLRDELLRQMYNVIQGVRTLIDKEAQR